MKRPERRWKFPSRMIPRSAVRWEVRVETAVRHRRALRREVPTVRAAALPVQAAVPPVRAAVLPARTAALPDRAAVLPVRIPAAPDPLTAAAERLSRPRTELRRRCRPETVPVPLTEAAPHSRLRTELLRQRHPEAMGRLLRAHLPDSSRMRVWISRISPRAIP